MRARARACVCVCMYVENSGKSKLLYLRNYSANGAEVWCAPKVTLSEVSFSLKLIHELGSYDDVNFF